MPMVDSDNLLKHIFTLGKHNDKDSILDLGKLVVITGTKTWIEIGCARFHIDAIKFLLKKHEEVFEDKMVRTIQPL